MEEGKNGPELWSVEAGKKKRAVKEWPPEGVGDRGSARFLSVKDKLQGPRCVVPKKISTYILDPTSRTEESFKDAQDVKYGVDDKVIVRVQIKHEDRDEMWDMICDSRARIDKFKMDIIEMIGVNSEDVTLEIFGGKRPQQQKPDAVLRDLAYKQFNEGSEHFKLEIKFLPTERQKERIQQADKEDEEELEKRNEPGTSVDGRSQTSQDQIEHRENQENQDDEMKPEPAEVETPGSSSTFRPDEPSTSQSQTHQDPEDSSSSSAPEGPSIAEPPQASPVDDDEMPSLTMEAPVEEASFEKETPPVSAPTQFTVTSSIPTQMPPKPRAKQIRRAPRSTFVTYQDLPPVTSHQSTSRPIKAEPDILSDEIYQSLSSALLTPVHILKMKTKADLEQILKGAYINIMRNLQKQEGQGHITDGQKYIVLAYHGLRNEREQLAQLTSRTVPSLPQQHPAARQMVNPVPQQMPNAQMRMPQVHVPIHPNQFPANQRPRVINIPNNVDPEFFKSLVKVNHVGLQYYIQPPAVPSARQNFSIAPQPPPQPAPQPAPSSSTSAPQQRLSSGVTFVQTENGERNSFPSDPCNFTPNPHTKAANQFISIASETFSAPYVAWMHFPGNKYGEVHEVNTIKAISEYREICQLFQTDPSHFLDNYYISEAHLPHFKRKLTAVEYNIHASRRRCDNANVRIPKLDSEAQQKLYALNLTIDDQDDEKWKQFYEIVGWTIPLGGNFPKKTRGIKSKSGEKRSGEPEAKKKRGIDDIANSIATARDSLQAKSVAPPSENENSPTSSEASSISPQMKSNGPSAEPPGTTPTTEPTRQISPSDTVSIDEAHVNTSD